MCKKKLVNECKVSGGRMTRALRWVRGMEQRGISGLTAAAVCAVGSGGGEGGRGRGGGGGGGGGDGFAGYLSVERGGVGESGWEGRRQLRRVQRV